MRAGKQGKALRRCRSGDEKVGTGVAMVMMAAGEMIARLAFIVRRVAMVIGVIVMAVMHGFDGETAETIMFVCHHQGGSMLQLVGRFCRQSRRVKQHERDAERRDQTVKSGGDRCEHGFACNCELWN